MKLIRFSKGPSKVPPLLYLLGVGTMIPLHDLFGLGWSIIAFVTSTLVYKAQKTNATWEKTCNTFAEINALMKKFYVLGHYEPHLQKDGGCDCRCKHCVAWEPPEPGRWSTWHAVCICRNCNENCTGVGRLGPYDSVMADRQITDA